MTTTTYTVTVTEGGCTSTNSITVIPADEFEFEVIDGGTNACDGQVDLTVNTIPGASIEWSTDPSFTTIISTEAQLQVEQTESQQSYFVRQILAEGCVTQAMEFPVDVVTLSIEGVTIDTVTNTPTITACEDEPITVTATTNANPSLIQWIDLETNGVLATGPSLTLDAEDGRTIRASLDTGTGCVLNSDDVQISPYDVRDDVSVDEINIPSVICPGIDIPISVTVNPAANIMLEWGPEECIVSGANTSTPVFTFTESKPITLSVLNQDNGCLVFLQFPISIIGDGLALDDIEITGDTDICDENVALTAIGSPGAIIEWSTDENFETILTEGSTLNTTQDDITETYFVRQRLGESCFSEINSIDVSRNDILIEGILDDNTLPFCSGDPIVINATTNAGAENIEWFDATTDAPIGFGVPLMISDGSIVEIYGTVTGESGCTFRTEDIMLVPLSLDGFVAIDRSPGGNGVPENVCAGESTQINVQPLTDMELIFEWAPGSVIESGQNTNSPIINLTEDTEITLSVTDPVTNCSIDTSFVIGVIELQAEVFADPSSRVYLGSDAELSVETNAENPTFEWSTGETTPTITIMPEESMSFSVTITDENGCMVVETINITVDTDCSASGIFLPNAFTPNADGVNDVLLVRTNSLQNVMLIIYDRWGREVFETTDLDIGWNGSWQNTGDELAPDAYGYYLSGVCFTGEEYTEKGNVSLLR